MSRFAPLALAAALALAAGAAHAADPLDLVATPASTTIGQATSVLMTVNLPNGLDLAALTFHLDWDSTKLSYNAAATTVLGLDWTQLSSAAFVQVNDAPGTFSVDGILDPSHPVAPGASSLNLSFTGLAAGVHSVKYSLLLTDASFADTFAEGNVAVTVSAIPEPSPQALLLAGLGVFGLLSLRHRGRRQD
jgi:hypothetical protein